MYENQANSGNSSVKGYAIPQPQFAGTVAPPRLSTLEEARNEVDNAAKMVSELSNMARQTADSVFGLVPESTDRAGLGTVGPAQPPRADALRFAIGNLHSRIAELRLQIERLTCV